MTKYAVIALAVIAIAAVTYSQNQAEEKEQAVKSEDPAATATPLQPATPLQRAGEASIDPDAPSVDPEKIDWKRVDWRRRLTPEEFHVTREAGTERAFTGKYWKLFDTGQYNCGNCGLPLFESTSKFDAHCGWPSFDQTIAKDSVVELEDKTHGMRRVEIRCRRCDAHLGHVFDDGPTKTGLRYCMNSASLDFVPAKDAVVKRQEAKEAATDKPAEKPAETESPPAKP